MKKDLNLYSAAFLSCLLLLTSSLTAGTIQQNFSYDAAGRLTQVTQSDDAATQKTAERYSYDASGNIIEKVVNGETVRMTYDAANQLQSRTDALGTVHFVYDSAGRLIEERRAGQVIVVYEYGYLDKVMQVTRGDQVTQFHYNARGMLVAKERDGQIIEIFGWDGIGLLAKNDTVYANEAHISGGVPLAAIDAGDAEAELQYFDSDYLGTTTAAYSADGAVDAKLVSSLGAGTEAEGVRFTGKPYDADLGAHVFPYRNYRADVGRWASADPAGFPDGPNQHYYACVPTTGLDPLGLATIIDTVGTLASPYSPELWTYGNSEYLQPQGGPGGPTFPGGWSQEAGIIKNDDSGENGWERQQRFRVTNSANVGMSFSNTTSESVSLGVSSNSVAFGYTYSTGATSSSSGSQSATIPYATPDSNHYWTISIYALKIDIVTASRSSSNTSGNSPNEADWGAWGSYNGIENGVYSGDWDYQWDLWEL